MEISSFFNSVSGDRKYAAEIWADYFSSFIENGIFYDELKLELNPSATNEMNVFLNTGKAFINGYFYHNTEQLRIDLEPADNAKNRIDSLVIQWNLSERQIKAKIRSSALAENPTPVTPVRNSEVYELVLYEIFIPKNSTTTSFANIRDKRLDTSACGFVTGVGQKIDTSKLDELIDNLFTRYDELVEKIEGAGITTYAAVDTSNNIKITAEGVTPKVGDIIAVRLTNPGNDGGVQPGATLTFNSDTKPIKCMDGAWTSKPIAQYSGAMLMYGNGYWTLLNFDGGMTNKTIAFPSGGIVIPENGVSLYVGQATSNVIINRASSSATKITANVIFRKGSATQITFTPDYLLSGSNVESLSSYSSSDYIVVSIVNGAPSVGKTI